MTKPTKPPKPTNPTHQSLYQKLTAIQSEIKKLTRSEENKQQDYYFFNEMQVLDLVKPLLTQQKLTLLISDDENKELTIEATNSLYLVKFGKKCQVIDYESPEQKLTFYFWATGLGSDPAQAKGAADTYAVKYFLHKLFLIPVQDDNDPDYQGEKPLTEQASNQLLNQTKPPQARQEFAPQLTATLLNIKTKFDKNRTKFLLLEAANLENNIFVFPYKVAPETWPSLQVGATYVFNLERSEKDIWVLIGFHLADLEI